MPTELDAVNVALTLLGESRITALTDDVKAAREANAIFVPVRDELMSRFNWAFAMKRGQAAKNATDPAFGFDNAFDFPSDCLRVVRPGDRYPGPDLTDYRNGPTAEYAIEAHQILTNWGPDGTNATGNADKVVSLTVTNKGFSYNSLPPTFTIAAPPAGGVQATGLAYLGAGGCAPNAGIPGANYSFYDTLTLVGGVQRLANKATFSLVQGIAPGAPVRYDVSNTGEYSSTPGINAVVEGQTYRQGAATTGGVGAGAQVDVWWRLQSAYIVNPGSGYIVPPIVTLNPGFGIGGAITAVLGDLALEYLNILYVARIEDAALWDPFFVKLLGAQLALDLCETITQSSSKAGKAQDYFNRNLREAVRMNSIQLPPQKLGDDEWMYSRL